MALQFYNQGRTILQNKRNKITNRPFHRRNERFHYTKLFTNCIGVTPAIF